MELCIKILILCINTWCTLRFFPRQSLLIAPNMDTVNSLKACSGIKFKHRPQSFHNLFFITGLMFLSHTNYLLAYSFRRSKYFRNHSTEIANLKISIKVECGKECPFNLCDSLSLKCFPTDAVIYEYTSVIHERPWLRASVGIREIGMCNDWLFLEKDKLRN